MMMYDSKHWLDRIRREQPGFLESVTAIADHMVEVMCRKQLDYGPDNINNAHGGPLNGLLVRMGDKYERIKNLTNTGSHSENEPLVDSFLDLANYCIIALMVIDGTWPKGDTQWDGTTNNTTTTAQAPTGSSSNASSTPAPSTSSNLIM